MRSRRGCQGGGEDDKEGGLQQSVCQAAEQEGWAEGGGDGLYLGKSRANYGCHQGG